MKKTVENLATSKISGGRRVPLRSKRKFEINRYPNEPIVGEQKTVTRKVRGKNLKTALVSAKFVNLSLPDSKVVKTKIVRVIENPTNNDYQRRGVITKGAIVETENGKCKIVSRPGQNGTLNGILIK